jgi:outer membrane protein assembly factor BamB
MWGGSPERNMVSPLEGLPAAWDIQKKTNVKWTAALGSQTYGNPTAANGVVLIGTNNDGLRDPKIKGDKGVLLAFDAHTGEFLWQAVFDKLPAGRVNDWPLLGIASSPAIEGDRAYFVTNRAQLVAVDLKGMADGNGGPYTAERHRGPKDADILWIFDMMAETGAHPHNLANGSPAIHGGLVYASTANGVDESHARVPSPKAPSIVAVDKQTGKLAWAAGYPGARILHGQWSSPAVGKIGDTVQVVSAEGDGWVRGYDAATGRQLWEFDTNPKDSVWPKTRNELISTPVIHNHRVYIANGQDPERGEGPGHLYAIDATRRGDITRSGVVWHYGKIRRSLSTAAIYDGIVYYADFSGFLHALDLETGKPYWVHDMLAAVWGSPSVIGGRVYLGDEDGDVAVLKTGKTREVIAEINMGSSVYGSAVAAHGTLYLANRNTLFAIAAR